MRYCLLILLLFGPLSVPVANAATAQEAGSTLIRNISMEGFVLDDKVQFANLFKPYRNKYLSQADIDAILQKLQEFYEEAGYQGLVSIEYQVKRKSLTFTVSLIK